MRGTGSLILIPQDLGVLARYANRVAVMYGGRIVEVAPAVHRMDGDRAATREQVA